jgi:Zn-dependent M28 family amino/carboxypeptidase
LSAGTLGETAQDGQPTPPDVTIPAVGISYAEGDRLANEADPTVGQVVVHAKSDQRKSTNILADTRSGDPDNVIIVGSHLDSVTEGPGINYNGSGSAFNLELALQLAKNKIRTENRVRFAWWGAEESGLVGATRYVAAITDEAFAQIAANLNFDMLASPNHGKFVYDGNFSDTPPPATAPNVNPGAAYIESVFLKYFASQDVSPDPTAFDGRSDYKPFQDNGVAAGGLFSGAEVAKSAAQAAKWGGTAGVAFDSNYHHAGDTIDNLDLAGWEQLADGGADALARLAEDRDLRGTLAGGAAANTAKKCATKARKAKKLSKARKAALGAYLGDRIVR